MIVKRFTLTPRLKARAFREAWWSTPAGKLRYLGSVAVFAFLIVFGAAQFFIDPELGFVGAALLWLTAAVWLISEVILVPAIQRWRFKRQADQTPLMRGEQVVEFSDSGVRTNADGAESYIEWKNISDVRLARHTVALFITRNQALFVPRELLSEQELAQVMTWAER